MGFEGKRILVTGGSRGIGRAAVIEFVSQGARLAVNGRTGTSTAAAIAAIDGGGRIVAAPGDVATRDGCYAIVDRAVSELGGLDILVTGVAHFGPFADVDEAIWDAALDINLKGTFFCCRLHYLISRLAAAVSSTSRPTPAS